MSEPDYLWDGSGEPDPDVEHLEKVLGPLRYDGQLPELPERSKAAPGGGSLSTPWALLSVAAAALLVAGAAILMFLQPDTETAPGDSGVGWSVAALLGTPKLGDDPLGKTGTLQVGQWLETDASSSAKIEIADIGQVEVGPRSKVKLVATSDVEHRLSLARGRLEAVVNAPPRLFVVDTPSAEAVDLGCMYTLEVDDEGVGVLDVTLGRVALEAKGRESIVPANARCRTRPGVGPGTPYFIDAADELLTALNALDFEELAPEALREAITQALCHTRERDSLTLWHMLTRVPADERGRVFDRMATLEAPPEAVTREGIVKLDRTMLDHWRYALGWDWE